MTERRPPKTGRRAAAPAAAAGSRSTLRLTWAAAVLALLVVLFFHELVVGGKTFVSPDALAPAGFAKIGEQSLYHDHVYPLWNPFVFLGMPSFASGTYNPLIYPPDWPLALVQKAMPFLPDMMWMLVYYFLGGFFMYLLAREWGARPEGALLGAVAFVFAPNLVAVGSHGHGSQLVDSMILPLMLWLGARWMRAGRLKDLGWLALAGGMQLLRGHVQICFYTWMALGLYALAAVIAAWRQGTVRAGLARALGMFLAAGIAFGIAGVYNLPLRDYAGWSIRGGTDKTGGVGVDYATAWSFAMYELPSIVVPGWVGFGGSTYWGGMPFTDYPNAFIGMVAAVLAVAAVFSHSRYRGYALALGAVALMVAFGKNFPLYGFLYAHLPLFNKFRVPVMIVILFQVAAALGLAWGWSAVLDEGQAPDEKRARLHKLLLGVAIALVAALLLGVGMQGAWRDAYVSMAVARRHAMGGAYSPDLAQQAYSGFIGDLGRACLLGLFAVGAALLALHRRLPASVASVIVLGLLMLELWPISGRLMAPVIGDPIQRNAEIGRDDVVDFLQKAGAPGTFRILPLEEFQDNRFAGFGIASVGGYHAAKPRRIQDFLEYGSGRLDLALDPHWMRLLNVRYLVTHQKLAQPPPGLALVHEGSENVYENQLALPRATLLDQYRVVRSPIAILDSVRAGGSDAARVTYLEQDPKLDLGPVEGAAAAISSYRLDDVTVDVDTPGPALLRLADAWYPDWTATVDGHPAPVYSADYLLRAVPVPAGKHHVEFVFRSKAVRRGLLLSIASLVVALTMLAVGTILERRRSAPPPAAAAA